MGYLNKRIAEGQARAERECCSEKLLRLILNLIFYYIPVKYYFTMCGSEVCYVKDSFSYSLENSILAHRRIFMYDLECYNLTTLILDEHVFIVIHIHFQFTVTTTLEMNAALPKDLVVVIVKTWQAKTISFFISRYLEIHFIFVVSSFFSQF